MLFKMGWDKLEEDIEWNCKHILDEPDFDLNNHNIYHSTPKENNVINQCTNSIDDKNNEYQ